MLSFSLLHNTILAFSQIGALIALAMCMKHGWHTHFIRIEFVLQGGKFFRGSLPRFWLTKKLGFLLCGIKEK